MQFLKKAILIFLALITWFNFLNAQPTPDRDGDGVPDYRDTCPDTDKNLNGHEFEVEVDGKKMFVKIVDFKGTFAKTRNRLLKELSNIKKQQTATPKPDEAQKVMLDSLEKQIRYKLIHLPYEAQITVNGKNIIKEVLLEIDEFGCLPDRDGDSVPDMVDKCPDTPGKKQYDGCDDRDGDGVLDHEDDCPDEPGLKRLKGCPDRGTGDRDKDGTIDKDDLCPDTPGPKANKGCPELINREFLEKASRVLFKSGSAILEPQSKVILDQLANEILTASKKFGKLTIRLEGHTDSDGTNEANLELSRNRARSVKDHLVSKGVDITWISTAGYGEEQPIATNATNPGKAQNRRVQIAVTNQ